MTTWLNSIALVTDPEALKEIQENQPQNSLEMPDISGALANFMTGKGDAKTKKN